MKELRGKNALLTGGSRGIGPEIAKALAAEGANLAIAARSAEKLKAVAAELTGQGVRAVAIPTDIADDAARRALVQQAEDELGQIDILINGAGIDLVGPFADQAEEDVARTIQVNLLAPLLLARLVLPGMIERRSGHIVMMSSLSGKKGIPYEATYSATKAGLIEWTEALRMELEGTGVGVSAICPSYVTGAGMFADMWGVAPKLAGSITPVEVARAVVRAIRNNKQEVIVRRTPTRPLLALNAMSPALGTLIIKGMGVVALQRKIAAKYKV